MNRIIRYLGIRDYTDVWEDMMAFTKSRTEQTQDEIWLLQHRPVFTQGTSCSDIPKTSIKSIPLIHSDRGGQITYHGPGQLLIYLLMDIKRLKSGPKSFVWRAEQLVIDFLNKHQIDGLRVFGAPGVYVNDKKIAAIGFRISKGRCYHGICINIDMDLSPYDLINPCGYPDLTVTQLKDHCDEITMDNAIAEMKLLLGKFCFNSK